LLEIILGHSAGKVVHKEDFNSRRGWGGLRYAGPPWGGCETWDVGALVRNGEVGVAGVEPSADASGGADAGRM
jgi:hypothetical protein